MKMRGQRWGKPRQVVLDNIDVLLDEDSPSTVGYSLVWNGSEFIYEAL